MKLIIIASSLIAASAATCAAAPATPTPHIGMVALTQTAPGTYSATITGHHFGTAPASVPCTACSPTEVQVVDIANQPHQLAIDVTSWTDTSITLANISAAAGTSLRLAVYNGTLHATAAWAGVTAPNKKLPRISSVTTTGSGATRVFTITGSGFGPAPASLGDGIDTPFLVLTTWNRAAPYTDGFPWNAGFCGAPDCNGVTANYTSWSDTQIVISGFGSSYANGAWSANTGDNFCVGVWPSTSTSNGTTGGRFKCGRLQ